MLDGYGDLEALLHLGPKLVHKSSAVPDEKSKLSRSKKKSKGLFVSTDGKKIFQRKFPSSRTVTIASKWL